MDCSTRSDQHERQAIRSRESGALRGDLSHAPASVRWASLAIVLGLALSMAGPASAAVELLGRQQVTFGWVASPSSVTKYDVFVACAPGPAPPPFERTPLVTLNADERQITIEGEYGDTCQIRVSGRNAKGIVTPLSDASEIIRFVEPLQPENDFDHDGSSDLVLQDETTGSMTIISGDSIRTGSEIDLGSPIQSNPLAEGWTVLASGDFDGDGAPEVLWREDVGSGTNYWAGHAPETAQFLGNFPETQLELIAVGDFDGDGRDDVFFWERTLGLLMGVFTRPDESVPMVSRYPSVAATRWDYVTDGDFNADGHRDLLWRSVSTGQTVAWLFSSNGRVSMMNSGAMPDLDWRAVATGNFNNASNDDVLWLNESTGETRIWYLDSLSSPETLELSVIMGGTWDFVASGDLNADGRDDVVWRDSNSQTIEIWAMDEYAQDGYYTY